MNSQSQKAKDIFVELIGNVPPDEWEHRLAEATGGDQELLNRVRALLRAHAEPGSFLEEPAVANQPDATLDQPITEKPGAQIGPYKLLQQIGEGGMGVVYMAEQKEPVKRRVALKIIKPGMDTRQVIARFEAERQALAMMDHPNIAKVLDAGATESGRPYFVMELVNGISVTKYCDQQHLTPRQRLELFVPICQAVQHAHQKGIIHRDLKPSNILVALYDGQPVPKVIDFGVAKATSQTLTEKTMFTQLGQVVGTLEYMSPEQAERNQLDIDTRSDIYSLGVVLYELLTGDTPFDRTRLRSAAFDEMLRIIREEEPSKPSAKVSSSQSLPSIAANRYTDPAKLSSLIRGELDWIVLKALEKDRGRRYETANAFAADVQHYLNDEAVVACPPSAGYKFRKFARRNKAVIGTTAAIAASLVIGTSVAIWQAIEATYERDRAVSAERKSEQEAARANREAQKATTSEQKAIAESKRAEVAADTAKRNSSIAHAVRDFLLRDLLGMADLENQIEAELKPDPDVTIRTLLDRAAKRLDNRFEDQPLVKAEIQHDLGRTYYAIGAYDKAEMHFIKAGDSFLTTAFAEYSRAPIIYKRELALAITAQGRYAEAELLFQDIVAHYHNHLGTKNLNTLAGRLDLAKCIDSQGRHIEAEQIYRDVLNTDTVTRESHSYQRLWSQCRFNLAITLNRLGRHHEAETLTRELLAFQQQHLGHEHSSTLLTMQHLAVTLGRQRRYAEAIELNEQLLAIHNRSLKPEDGHLLAIRNTLSIACTHHSRDLRKGHHFASAIAHLERAVQLGSGTPSILSELAACHLASGNKEASENIWNQVVELFPLPDKRTVADWGHYAQCLYQAGRYDEAREGLEKAIELRGDDGPSLKSGPRWWYYTLTLCRLGETDQARIYHDQLSQMMREKPPKHFELWASLQREAAELLKLEVEPPGISTTPAGASQELRN